MFRVFAIVCILSIATGQAVDEAACKEPFRQHPTRPDLCYTRLAESICDLIPGSQFLYGNCLIRAENNSKANDVTSFPLPTSTFSSLATTASPATTVTPDPYPQCEDTSTGCQEAKIACTAPRWQKFMIATCARTCGYCHCDSNTSKCDVTTTKEPTTLPPIPQCEDNAANCQLHLCHNANYSDMYKKHCRKTCGYCNCRNNNRNCAMLVRAGSCDVMALKDFMMRHCREACGWC
uniref:ShTK domain protein n=1 Tax=Panagrellus redivivus TaxID=6233 RepID=A0A7E4VRI7_PANRE